MIDPTKSVIDVYDTITQAYVKQFVEDNSDKPHVDTFLSKLPLKAKILDAGCGAGQTTSYMGKKGFRVTGIDLSKNMLAVAKNKYPEPTFVIMDMRDLQFAPEQFDGVLSSYSLIHIPDAKIHDVLSGFYRVLKHDGWVAIFAQQGKPDQYVDEPFAPGKKTFFNFFTQERITRQLEDAGFSAITIQSEYCDDLYNMSDTNLYIFAKK